MTRYKLTVDGNRGLLESDSPITDRNKQCLERQVNTTHVARRDAYSLVVMKPTLLGWSGIASAMEVFLPGIWECDLPIRPEQTPPPAIYSLAILQGNLALLTVPGPSFATSSFCVGGIEHAVKVDSHAVCLIKYHSACWREIYCALIAASPGSNWGQEPTPAPPPAVTREWADIVAGGVADAAGRTTTIRFSDDSIFMLKEFVVSAILHFGHLVEPPKPTKPLNQPALERIAAEFNDHYPPGTAVFVTYDGGRQAFETIRRPAYAADGYVRVVTSDIDIVTLDRIVPIRPPTVPTLEDCDSAAQLLGTRGYLSGNAKDAGRLIRAELICQAAKQADQPPATE